MRNDSRRPFVAGNWKMNTTLPEAVALADGLKRRIGRIRSVDMAVIPPSLFVERVASRLAGERIAVGGQDIHPSPKGAFTGAISGSQLKSAGATFVLVGHSERRHVFGDTDAVVAEKVLAGLAADLDVMLCIGERLPEREASRTFEVCETQLSAALKAIDTDAMARVTIAYEPVWAIGTGKTASPAQAQEVHRFVREWLLDRYDGSISSMTRIMYGGSVKPANTADLMAGSDVDGALVGGASLDADSFAAIVAASQPHSSQEKV
ncbi:MAG: triosephosphate isomerase [Myxococcota bacterium]|jgi:triosephosphate isomerase